MNLGNVYSVRFKKTDSSTRILDEFDRWENNKRVYDTLLLDRVISVNYRNTIYFIGLYIQRMPYGSSIVSSTITYTDLRQVYGNRMYRITDRKKTEITDSVLDYMKRVKLKNHLESQDVSFDIPVKFNAQNSGNRSGFYCELDTFGNIIDQKQYGDTNDYMFVGMRVTRWY